MLHEEFYASGTLENPELGVAAAFVTLDSSRFPEPVWNDDKSVGCFLAGEPFLDSKSGGDVARILVDLYAKLGVQALEKLNGWFSGLIFDLRNRQTVLFNDRFGLSRIYFSQKIGRLFFASEAKSLLALLPESRQADVRGLAEWFTCGCPLGNRTLFQNVSLLPPASAWFFNADGSLRKQTYFDPASWENQPQLPPQEFAERLSQSFPRALSRYVNGSRLVAMSLTGGLDGRMIMAWARPPHGGMPCYTFNGTYRDCADVRIARKVAAACGQKHQTISVGNEFLAQFPRLAEESVAITDGVMDVTGAAELYVNRLARRIAPVRLTGNYGSEILRRYVAFRPRALTPGLFATDFERQCAAVSETYEREFNCNRLSFIAFKQVPWHHYSRLAVEQSQVSVRSPFLDNELVALAYQGGDPESLSARPSLRLIVDGNAALGRIPTDRGITWPADRMANRMHRSVQEFLAKAEYAYDYGMPDWLARVDKYLAPLQIERLFLGRQKFVHFRGWYRNQLAGYVREILLDSRAVSRAWVNGPAVEQMVRAHVAGMANHTVEIHKLLTMELLHRQLLDAR